MSRHLTWICQDCGAANECTDAACQCEHDRERQDTARWALIERSRHLAPRVLRERLSRQIGRAA